MNHTCAKRERMWLFRLKLLLERSSLVTFSVSIVTPRVWNNNYCNTANSVHFGDMCRYIFRLQWDKYDSMNETKKKERIVKLKFIGK